MLIKFHATQNQNLCQNIATVPVFHSGGNHSGTILDDLPIKINVFSQICILNNDLDIGHHLAYVLQ